MLLDTLLGWFSTDMGIDLGTCTTLVCVRDKGIVLNEPSVVAVRKGTNIVLQAGILWCNKIRQTGIRLTGWFFLLLTYYAR